MKPLDCPLCGDGKMKYDFTPTRPNGREDVAHFWICDTCPAVLLEWWDQTDSEGFVKRFGGGKYHNPHAHD